jgi:hypothetical protein
MLASNSKFQNGVLIEELIDNGDGTGTLTDFRTDPPTVSQVTGLPVPEPDPMSTLLEKLADAQSLEEVRTAAAEAQGSI